IDHRVVEPGLLPVLAQAIAVRLEVTEAERVYRIDVGVDLLVAPLIEQGQEPLAGRYPEMVVTLGADVGVPEHFLFIDDLLARVAFDPEAFGNLDPPVLDRLLRLADLLEPRDFHRNPMLSLGRGRGDVFGS